MTESEVLFDTWAWWEYLHGTPTGVSLGQRFVDGAGTRIHTSAITLGELAGKLTALGAGDRVAAVCGFIRRASRVWDVTGDIAMDAGVVRQALRRASPSASLADGIVAVTARRARSRIVSADPAFRDTPGVILR